MKRRKLRGLTDPQLHTILGEFHTVLNQHAQVVNQQRVKISELHARLQVLEAAAGILPEGASVPVEGEVIDEIAPPLTKEQWDIHPEQPDCTACHGTNVQTDEHGVQSDDVCPACDGVEQPAA